MALNIEIEVERLFTDAIQGENTDMQDLLDTRATADWQLVSTLPMALGVEALLFFERITAGPP